ncbi:MAG: hypothetical protein ACRDIY_18485 [Chloroflexota bacterium]
MAIEKPASENAPARMTGTDHGRLVLLISEDPLMSRALSRLLRKAGYEVVACEGSCSVIGADGSDSPSLVIVDVPDDPAPKRAPADDRPAGWTDAASVLWIGDAIGTSRRGDGHLTKPFTSNELLSTVASLLDS